MTTTQELAALARRRLMLIPVLPAPVVPDEDAAQHLRNGLMILRGLEATEPAFWADVPELARAERCARYALTLVGTPHAGPHVERAVLALAGADPVAWGTCPEIGGACARFMRAFFALGAGV